MTFYLCTQSCVYAVTIYIQNTSIKKNHFAHTCTHFFLRSVYIYKALPLNNLDAVFLRLYTELYVTKKYELDLCVQMAKNSI